MNTPAPWVQGLMYGIAALAAVAATLVLLASHSTAVMNVDVDAIMLYHRVTRFPTFSSERHASCTVGDAWLEAVPSEENAAKERIQARNRVLKADGDLILVDTSNGQFWIPKRDLLTLAEMIGEQNRDIYGTGGRGVRLGDVVLDVGANAGVFTRHALASGASLVVAIDPAPVAVECLRRNFHDEIAAGRVIVYPKGAWNRDDTLELTSNAALATTANSVAINRGDRGPRVPLTTLDAMVRELRLTRADFIKMDIEGAEGQALEGARETLTRFHPRMAVALEHRPTDVDTLPVALHGVWPKAVTSFGPCVNVAGRLQPQVLFAQQ